MLVAIPEVWDHEHQNKQLIQHTDKVALVSLSELSVQWVALTASKYSCSKPLGTSISLWCICVSLVSYSAHWWPDVIKS